MIKVVCLVDQPDLQREKEAYHGFRNTSHSTGSLKKKKKNLGRIR